MYTTTDNTGTVQKSYDYTALNQKKTTTKTDMEVQQDRFMKLLVKQLQTQDPMNPMENAEMTSQMAQINTVTGIEKLNTAMQQMMATFTASQGLQAAGLVGHQVLAPGSVFLVDGKNGTEMKLDLSSPAKNIKVEIQDSTGAKVAELTVKDSDAGTIPVAWDGKKADGTMAPAGVYKIVASGTVDGKVVALDTKTWQQAMSVQLSSSGVKVELLDGSMVDFSKVTQIQ